MPSSGLLYWHITPLELILPLVEVVPGESVGVPEGLSDGFDQGLLDCRLKVVLMGLAMALPKVLKRRTWCRKC